VQRRLVSNGADGSVSMPGSESLEEIIPVTQRRLRGARNTRGPIE
jgi:hypothetical protein